MTPEKRGGQNFEAGSEDDGQRLDKFLNREIDFLSRQRIKSLILEGQVSVDAQIVGDPSLKVRAGSVINVIVPPPRDERIEGEDLRLNVVFEDEHLIVIDKPAGLVVHPGPGNETGTLVNALIAHCGDSLSGIGGVRRPGIVHRLDKDTSGLLVAAKSDVAHRGLAEQFQSHGLDGRLRRAYLALAWGRLEPPVGVIDAPLGRHRLNRRKMAVVREEDGRHAVTHFHAEDAVTFGDNTIVSLVRLTLETGRTHQIRVHLTAGGHPLLGDRVYGAGFKASEANLPMAVQVALNQLDRQALHAALLGFEHPIDGTVHCYCSQLPDDFAALCDALGITAPALI